MNRKSDERRQVTRFEQRLAMIYTAKEVRSKASYTVDLSQEGLFVLSKSLVHAGTHLTIDIELPDRSVRLNGTVRWGRKVPPNVSSHQNSGFGIRLEETPEVWVRFVADLDTNQH